jgi:hypothetical protein
MRRAFTEAGAKFNRPIARLDHLTEYELESLVTGAGFEAYKSDLRTFVNTYSDVAALLASIESAFFGNFLANSSKFFRARVQYALDRLLEVKRLNDQRIQLERYLIFATAKKPNVI